MLPWWSDHRELAGFAAWLHSARDCDAHDLVTMLYAPWEQDELYAQYQQARYAPVDCRGLDEPRTILPLEESELRRSVA